VVLAVLLAVPGCSRDPYSQDTPEETISSARLMIEKGEASKLPRLVYAESEDMRRWLNRTGKLLGNLQSLSGSIQEKYPKEVSELSARAQEAAKQGKATSLIGQLSSQMRQQQRSGARTNRGGRRGGPPRGEARDDFNDAVTRVFADPYAFLKESEGKLTAVMMDDETYALQWEGKPVLAPLGMLMKKGEDGKWYFVLPTNVPGASQFLPKTKEQWDIMGKLVVTLDKVVADLDREIRDGRLETLPAVSRRAGEMTFAPAVMVFYAYAQYTEASKKADAGK
jgi:hypothetical protein